MLARDVEVRVVVDQPHAVRPRPALRVGARRHGVDELVQRARVIAFALQLQRQLVTGVPGKVLQLGLARQVAVRDDVGAQRVEIRLAQQRRLLGVDGERLSAQQQLVGHQQRPSHVALLRHAAVFGARQLLLCRLDVAGHLVGDGQVKVREVIDVLLRPRGDLQPFGGTHSDGRCELRSRRARIPLFDQAYAALVVVEPGIGCGGQQEGENEGEHAGIVANETGPRLREVPPSSSFSVPD